MIIRHTVSCSGCEAHILLRISVGLDDVQPFYFVCSKCNAATRGKLLIQYEPELDAKLEIESGEILAKEEDISQTISIHSNLPMKAEAKEMWDDGGSPFIMHFSGLGDNYYEFDARLKEFKEIAKNDWLKVQRWIGYYLDNNWSQFDLEYENIFKGSLGEPKEIWHRHDLLHRSLDFLFSFLWVDPYYPNMKKEWAELVVKGEKENLGITDYMEKEMNSGNVNKIQKEIFHCLSLFMKHRDAILPGLVIEMYEPERKERLIEELRLFRDEFSELRDLYISTFEACHDTLKFVMAINNIVFRGNADDFGSSPKTPNNMKKFEKLTSFNKSSLINNLPSWEANWNFLLNRKIRNAIGHNSVRHDLPSGLLILDDGTSLPYLEFVIMTLRLIHPLLLSANVLKTYCIASTMNN